MENLHVRTEKKTASDTHNLSDWADVRTEHQIPRGLGFQPESIRHRDARWSTNDNAARTPQLAKPPHWTETPGLPCVPLDKLGRKTWDVHWEPARQVSEERQDKIAAELCRSCPVRMACLEDAMAQEVDSVHGKPLHHSSRFLVRGGLTPKGRWRLTVTRQGEGPLDTSKDVVTTG